MIANGLPAGAAGHVDHIGVAVTDLVTAIALYRDLLGLELARVEEVPSEQVQVAFLKLDRTGGRGHLELLAPLGTEGAIARAIAKRGPGLHHVAIAVPDVPAAMSACAAAGLELLDAQPRSGAAGKQAAFVHPRSAGGVLIELCGPAPDLHGAS